MTVTAVTASQHSIFLADGTVRHWVAPVGTALHECSRIQKYESNTFDTWIRLARVAPEQIDSIHLPVEPALTTAVRYLLDSTQLSNRQLATLLGTTHPTIASVLRGREPVRVDGLSDAVIQTQSVVERLTRLVGPDTSLLRLALHATDGEGESVQDLLRQREYSRAYLEALTFIKRHGQTVQSKARPRRRRQPGCDTEALDNND